MSNSQNAELLEFLASLSPQQYQRFCQILREYPDLTLAQYDSDFEVSIQGEAWQIKYALFQHLGQFSIAKSVGAGFQGDRERGES
ncbi:MAG: hypothetical protein JGK21_21645 [Microcoleus sp. PH2017_22_RUC_O_B]|uniref:hypothetical protein n=1 Tax=unclassified Microcoleus TaxID=2642155 RepID=UPI001DEBE20D|nr:MULTISPECIES: hypothetical protein [unclassified Microcoleus]MCC3529564.1 hypothetical protein [Microcoleus sp. PH2017_21_RUC_O_A]MCC3542906.1 hypothetical protein [Microcoleus sp. PH2017_22_RUC_O_B]